MKNQEKNDENKGIGRKPGALKDQITIPDEFFEPMNEEELALWYDGPIFPEDNANSDLDGEKM